MAAPSELRPIRVLVAEDEEPLRLALGDLIAGEPGLELVATAAHADEAIADGAGLQPDVALLDVKMPAGGGRRAAQELRARSPGTAIVALSAYEDRATVVEMMSSGAIGSLVKGAPPEEILEAIRRAARGQSSLSAAVTTNVIEELV